jgi:hypothetical protein
MVSLCADVSKCANILKYTVELIFQRNTQNLQLEVELVHVVYTKCL